MPSLVVSIAVILVAGLSGACWASSQPVRLPHETLGLLWTLCLATMPGVMPGEVWSSWSLAPEIVIPLASYALVYAFGRLRAHRPSAVTGLPPVAATGIGLLLLVVALVSPLCRLSATLAWAHMVQHVILVALAPPLLLLGAPGRTLAAALPRSLLPRSLRRGGAAAQLRAVPLLPAGLVYGAAIWFWHVPRLYEASLTSAPIHLALVFSLLAAGLLFWRAVIAAAPEAFGTATLVLLATMMHTGLLGALLTFAPTPWYPVMAPGALAWGLHPLEDQQLAGVIMWAPMGGVYMVAALVIVGLRLTAGTPEPAGGRGRDLAGSVPPSPAI